MSTDNPFNAGYGVAPPRFVGRDEQVHQILLELRRGPGRDDFHSIVTGARGTGKTVLLGFLRRHVEQEWEWPTIRWAGGADWPLRQVLREEAVRVERELTGPLRRAGRAVRPDTVEARTPVGTATKRLRSSDDEPSVVARLRRLGVAARDRRRVVVLFIDELQAVAAADLAALSGAMQVVANDERLPVAVVAAGLPRLRQVLEAIPGTTFLERQPFLQLTNLHPDDTREALHRPILEARRRIEPNALDLLVALSGGYPYAVQLVGKHTWNAAAERRTIRLADAVAGCDVADQILSRDIYQSRWERLTPLERSYLHAAARLGGPRGSSTAAIAASLGSTTQGMSPTRDSLIKVHHLLRAGDHGFVHFEIPGLADWIVTHLAATPPTPSGGPPEIPPDVEPASDVTGHIVEPRDSPPTPSASPPNRPPLPELGIREMEADPAAHDDRNADVDPVPSGRCYGVVVRADGERQLLTAPVSDHHARQALGGATLTTATIRWPELPHGELMMYVDDNGYRDNLPANHYATELYGSGWEILGDVVVCCATDQPIPDDLTAHLLGGAIKHPARQRPTAWIEHDLDTARRYQAAYRQRPIPGDPLAAEMRAANEREIVQLVAELHAAHQRHAPTPPPAPDTTIPGGGDPGDTARGILEQWSRPDPPPPSPRPPTEGPDLGL